MRALVAGGAGFIGSHLVDRMLDRGDEVVCVDDLSTGVRASAVFHADDPSYRFIEHDVTDPALDAVIESAIGGSKGADPLRFDAIVHLASPASPPAYLARPIETLDVGSIGTKHLLEIARRDDARFLLASTSEVYGDPLEHPQAETYHGNVDPVGVRSVYDESKRFAESLTMAYARHHGLEVRIARIFNTYGPRMRPDDGRVVTNFIHQALADEPLTVYGTGEQTRSFCYVDDLVDGILALLDGDEVGPVNIGNPDEVTMSELARLVIELTGSRSGIVSRPAPEDDPQRRQPDITLARQRLAWEPAVSLRDGLVRAIESFRPR